MVHKVPIAVENKFIRVSIPVTNARRDPNQQGYPTRSIFKIKMNTTGWTYSESEGTKMVSVGALDDTNSNVRTNSNTGLGPNGKNPLKLSGKMLQTFVGDHCCAV